MRLNIHIYTHFLIHHLNFMGGVAPYITRSAQNKNFKSKIPPTVCMINMYHVIAFGFSILNILEG